MFAFVVTSFDSYNSFWLPIIIISLYIIRNVISMILTGMYEEIEELEAVKIATNNLTAVHGGYTYYTGTCIGMVKLYRTQRK